MAQGDRMQLPPIKEGPQDGGLGGVTDEGGATAGATTITESAGGDTSGQQAPTGNGENLGDDEVVPS